MPINKPAIDEICEKVDSRYTLVVASAKRARELIDGSQPSSLQKTKIRSLLVSVFLITR